MKIYTYQSQELIDFVNDNGFAPVIFEKTNIFNRHKLESDRRFIMKHTCGWRERLLRRPEFG